MKKKLTLTIDKDLLHQVKIRAAWEEKTISGIVEKFLRDYTIVLPTYDWRKMCNLPVRRRKK